MKIHFAQTIILFAIFLLISSCSTKEIQGTKSRTYRLNIIPSNSSVHFIFNGNETKKGLTKITLPNWVGCEDVLKKGPFSRCTANSLNNYFNSNLQIPPEALSSSLEGKTKVKFQLNKEGNVENIKILKDPGGGIGLEIQRLVQSLPPWESAQINEEENVATEIEMEIFFDLVLR